MDPPQQIAQRNGSAQGRTATDRLRDLEPQSGPAACAAGGRRKGGRVASRARNRQDMEDRPSLA
jgi:hypothetical protein